MKRSFFVGAPDSTSKALVSSVLQRCINSKGLTVLTIASSAAADQLLDGERKAHSAVEIHIPVRHQCTCFIDVNSSLANKVCKTSLFISDESVMAHRHYLENVGQTFRDMMWFTLPFGGTLFLCPSDARQILPILRACANLRLGFHVSKDQYYLHYSKSGPLHKL